MKASVPELFDAFVDAIATLAVIAACSFVVAMVLLALVRRFLAEGSTGRLAATIVLILAVVFSFAGSSLYAELEAVDLARQTEESNLKLDVETMCQSPDVLEFSDQAQLLEVANYIAKSSQTLKEVTADADLSGKPVDAASANQILDTFKVVGDDTAVNNLKMNSYIEAVLMLLLAFMVVYELQNKARKEQKQKKRGVEATLSENDYRMRMVLVVVGICMAAFNVVSVLRIRQVVMLHWTENVALLVSVIFTCTMVANVIGSFISSIILESCKSVKTYAVVAVGTAMAGAFMCGASFNIVIFIVGLLVFNVGGSMMLMLSDFHTSLISDINRKDVCQVELVSGFSLGQVIGNIIGGVISVVLSYAVVQVMAAVFLGAALFLCFSLSKDELALHTVKSHGVKSNMTSVLKVLIKGDVLVYAICIILPSAIAQSVVQYKLPLDVAALGLSALVVSLAKTTQRVVRVYANPLYHVVSRHVSATFHLVAYVALCGGVVLFYVLSYSLAGMIITVGAIGFINGAGGYATTKVFREMDVLSGIQESDRMVGLDLIRRIGSTVSPTLLSVCGNSVALLIAIAVAPFIYLAKVKSKARE